MAHTLGDSINDSLQETIRMIVMEADNREDELENEIWELKAKVSELEATVGDLSDQLKLATDRNSELEALAEA